jgi:hypothetical protein
LRQLFFSLPKLRMSNSASLISNDLKTLRKPEPLKRTIAQLSEPLNRILYQALNVQYTTPPPALFFIELPLQFPRARGHSLKGPGANQIGRNGQGSWDASIASLSYKETSRDPFLNAGLTDP